MKIVRRCKEHAHETDFQPLRVLPGVQVQSLKQALIAACQTNTTQTLFSAATPTATGSTQARPIGPRSLPGSRLTFDEDSS